MNESKIEYTTNGVNVVDRDNIRDTETSEKVPINTPQISEESSTSSGTECQTPIKINKQRFNSRSITKKTSPKIYVNDGSNGTNLINTHSYKNYCTPNEKPTIENNYSNNFKSALTTNTKYNEIMTLRVSGGALNSKFIGGPIDGFRLHPTGDSGGYSNFTISHFIKGN